MPAAASLLPRLCPSPDERGTSLPSVASSHFLFPVWALQLLPAAFLLSTLHPCRAPAHALFPLPVPYAGISAHVPTNKSTRVRGCVAVRRPMASWCGPLASWLFFAVSPSVHCLGSFHRSFPTLVLRRTPTAASVKVSDLSLVPLSPTLLLWPIA